jgi:hypothetical protein
MKKILVLICCFFISNLCAQDDCIRDLLFFLDREEGLLLKDAEQNPLKYHEYGMHAAILDCRELAKVDPNAMSLLGMLKEKRRKEELDVYAYHIDTPILSYYAGRIMMLYKAETCLQYRLEKKIIINEMEKKSR